MSRLIDADKLLEGIAELKQSPWFNNKYGYADRKEAVETIEDLCIKKEPTVEERKKGRWINDQSGYYANCSECGYQMDTHTERGYFNFCPNCGADMRGEEDSKKTKRHNYSFGL